MFQTRPCATSLAIAATATVVSLSAPAASALPIHAASQAQSSIAAAPAATTEVQPQQTALPKQTAASTATLQQRIDSASTDFKADGGKVGIALLDRNTGTMLTNDAGQKTFPLASVTKILIAEQVAFHNYTHPDDDIGGQKTAKASPAPDPTMTADETKLEEMLARDDMIRLSDNESTDLLWKRYGGNKIIGEVADRYDLKNTKDGGLWAAAQSTAEDMALFLGGVLDGDGGLGPRETNYFADLLHSVPKYSYGMMDQDFGVRGGLPGESVGTKDGWDGNLINNSTGIFGPDNQFVMVVLSGNSTPEDVTKVVQTVFPEGKVSESGGTQPPIAVPNGTSAAAANDFLSLSPAALWVTGMLVVLGLGFSLGWVYRSLARDY